MRRNSATQPSILSRSFFALLAVVSGVTALYWLAVFFFAVWRSILPTSGLTMLYLLTSVFVMYTIIHTGVQRYAFEWPGFINNLSTIKTARRLNGAILCALAIASVFLTLIHKFAAGATSLRPDAAPEIWLATMCFYFSSCVFRYCLFGPAGVFSDWYLKLVRGYRDPRRT